MPSFDGALSYLRGPPLPNQLPATLWDALEQGDLTAPWLVFHTGKTRETLTRADVIDRALGWAAALSPLGSESRIGILLPNSPDFVAAFFAAQALGAIAVPMPWPVVDGAPERLRESLQPILRSARVDALVTTPPCAAVDWGTRVVTTDSLSLRSAERGRGEALHPHRLAFLQFTSGSTADPRGAMISQRAAVASASSMVAALELKPSDVGVSWLPFFHDMGLVGVLLTSLLGHFPVHVLRPGDFLMRPRRWLELVSSERATLTVGPNFAWELLARRVSAEGLELSCLRCALNGSEPIHRSTLDHVAERFGIKSLCVYGLAEATLGVAFSRPGVVKDDLTIDGRAVPSVGSVLPGLELSVVDPNGDVLPLGEQGELCVRGPMVMEGYFEHPDATASALQGGWLRTGDLGVVRDGAVYVTGREKELVIQAGRKFHPYDIERVVSAMVETTPNGVAAVSRPDPELGSEALVVVVELRRQSGAVDPLKIKGELLRSLGVRADSIVYVPAGSLPRTTSGKVKRRALVNPLSVGRSASAPLRGAARRLEGA